MNLPKKIFFTAAVGFIAQFSSAQTVQEGIQNVDSHKYAKARDIYNQMISSNPDDADNYFYLGNTYLTQFDPNFVKAEEYFRKGLSISSKSYLNKIGLASVKLGQGDKSAVSEIQSIVSDSREKDPEVLYRAAEALTMYDKYNAPDVAIDFLNKAVDKSKKGVPAYYYYSLGDAYRLKKMPGDAMTAYDKASAVANNKASVFTRMGTLWMAAQQWKLAKENIDKAIAADATYAPAYKAKAAYDIKYQQNNLATQDLLNYAKYADEDPYTQLEIAKLFFINEDYKNAKSVLDKVFDRVEDPVKYKLRAYISYGEADYATAKQNIDSYISKVGQSKLIASDSGLLGLIEAGLSKDEPDETRKSQLVADAQSKINIAKAAKDETLKWDEELMKILGGGGASQAAADSGPTSPAINALKKQIAANPNDVDAIVKLGAAYQEVQNWNGAILTWDKMIVLSPDWPYSYYAKGAAYQQMGNNALAEHSYQKYIDTVLSKTPAEQDQNKETLSYAYYLVAYFNQNKDLTKAKDYAAKAVQLNPAYQDAVALNTQLNK
ncbi:tetratricopeptide repeat protein [Daejeonia sp. YH14]|uniref:tetratricopeptide repeat protein n=1 Tax=Daejeonia sp. YH14 TaxID=3439042 RepID=UPI003F4940EB